MYISFIHFSLSTFKSLFSELQDSDYTAIGNQGVVLPWNERRSIFYCLKNKLIKTLMNTAFYDREEKGLGWMWLWIDIPSDRSRCWVIVVMFLYWDKPLILMIPNKLQNQPSHYWQLHISWDICFALFPTYLKTDRECRQMRATICLLSPCLACLVKSARTRLAPWLILEIYIVLCQSQIFCLCKKWQIRWWFFSSKYLWMVLISWIPFKQFQMEDTGCLDVSISPYYPIRRRLFMPLNTL